MKIIDSSTGLELTSDDALEICIDNLTDALKATQDEGDPTSPWYINYDNNGFEPDFETEEEAREWLKKVFIPALQKAKDSILKVVTNERS